MYFNAAAILERGELVRCPRKTHITEGEQQVFEPGDAYPVFDLDGLKFGINICYDMQFPEAAAAVAAAGAALLVCPANNMLTRANAESWKYRHNELRCEHARKSALWLLSSDVTGSRGERISYGPTALIDPSGTVTDQVPLMETGTLFAEIK